jgi:anti-sigma B factor antagonist
MPEQPRHRLKVENIGDITVVHFTDKKIQDKPNIQIIGDELFQLVDNMGRCRLLLDFNHVEYLSSGALGKLITLQNKVKAAGGWLVLCNIEPRIHEVLKISKLDRIFRIHPIEADPAAGLARLLAELKAG